MRPSISAEAQRSHLGSMRLLLEAERAALGHIARASLMAASGFLRSVGDAAAAAYQLETALAPVLDAARRGGRDASMRGLGAEYGVARREAVAAGVDPFSMPLVVERGDGPGDGATASLAAKEIATLYEKRATAALKRADGRSVSARSALPVYAIEEKAATQTAEAFADERVRAERRMADRYAGTNWLPALVKLWDATIDRKTCGVCREMDGQFRVYGTSFSGGRTPALVHRKCRCLQVTIFAPLYMGRKEREET